MATVETLTTQKQQISVTLREIADLMREVVNNTDLSEQEQEEQINELKQRIDAELLKRHNLSVEIINILMGQPDPQAGGSRKRRRRRKTKRR
jgi:DNA-binding protein H-NS